MPIIPSGDHGQLTFFYNAPGQSTEDAQVTIGIGATPSQSVVNSVDTFWKNNFEEITNVEWILLRTELRTSESVVFTSTNAQRVGARSGDATPPQICYLVNKVTGVGGRRGRGRMYLPGCNHTEIDSNGQLSSGILNDLGVQLSAFQTAVEALGWELELFHSSAPTTAFTIVDLVPQALCATQRRRLDR
jgi:hypothetical protein